MKKEDVVWHEEDEYIVMSENGWKLLLVANHFKYNFWYEIQNPDGYYLDFITENIYEAIDKINQEQKIKN